MVKWDEGSEALPTRELRALRALCADIVELRRGDHSAARLKLEEGRLELERSKEEARVQERFEQWVKQPEIKERICGTLSIEQREDRIREIFGRPKAGLSKETVALIQEQAGLL
jgi:hypothetical protein